MNASFEFQVSGDIEHETTIKLSELPDTVKRLANTLKWRGVRLQGGRGLDHTKVAFTFVQGEFSKILDSDSVMWQTMYEERRPGEPMSIIVTLVEDEKPEQAVRTKSRFGCCRTKKEVDKPEQAVRTKSRFGCCRTVVLVVLACFIVVCGLWKYDLIVSLIWSCFSAFPTVSPVVGPDAPVKNHVQHVFIGNPGTGKSFLINQVINEIAFGSGLVTDGVGKTKMLNRINRSGQTYADTPGLADIAIREKASAAIKEAMMKTGLFKIFFVVVLTAGRITPEDKATIQAVLEAAEPITQYNIIINKVEPQLLVKWKNETAKKIFNFTLLQNLAHQDEVRLHTIPFEMEVFGAENALWKDGAQTDALRKFVKEVPAIHMDSSRIKDIQLRNFEEMIKKLQESQAQMQRQVADFMENERKKEEQLRSVEARLEETEGKLHETKGELNETKRQLDETAKRKSR